MRNVTLLAATVLALSLLPATEAGAVKLARHVVGSGAANLSGPGTRILGTFGQSAAGLSTGSGEALYTGYWYPLTNVATAISELPGAIPLQFALAQNAPNPFRPRTTIRFALPVETTVSLKLFDVGGRLARTLADGSYPPGHHSIVLDGHRLGSGVYFYQMRAGGFVETKKLTILK